MAPHSPEFDGRLVLAVDGAVRCAAVTRRDLHDLHRSADNMRRAVCTFGLGTLRHMLSGKLNTIVRRQTTRSTDMTKHIPTRLGDVLILRTNQSFTMHVLGEVSRDGQQDFQNQTNTRYVIDRAVAVTEAKAIRAPGRRIFLRNIDTDDWAEIVN
jgi:hypothetical protein